jgi:hypothetical protein
MHIAFDSFAIFAAALRRGSFRSCLLDVVRTSRNRIEKPSAWRSRLDRRRHLISDPSSNGLLRKPTAPPSRARFLSRSFGKAVIRITGVRHPRERSVSCNSRPLNPDIRKSVITHVVSAITLDSRKSSAELKVTVRYPNDSTSSRMPSRASASSSIIEINVYPGILMSRNV